MGYTGMPVSQHPPKKQQLPTPLLLLTNFSHPWEVMLQSVEKLEMYTFLNLYRVILIPSRGRAPPVEGAV